MKCSRCKSPIPSGSTFCNHCGAKQGATDEPVQGSAGRWVVVVAGAVLATGALSAVLASGALDGYLTALEPPRPGASAEPVRPASGAAPTSSAAPTSGVPSSSPKTKTSPPTSGAAPRPSAFTINLDSEPAGATVQELDGTAIGQTPTSVVLPATTIVEFSLAGFDDTCRYELSAKLRDQTIKCNFKKPSAGANPDSKPPKEQPPSSGPVKKTGSDKPKKAPTSGPSR